MKNVLLLTDLTVQSLFPVHSIVRDVNNEKVTINVVHMLDLPTSIIDLLFLEENKPYNKIPVHFIEALQVLCNKHKKSLEKIDFNFMYCGTSRYLNNYIEANNIDSVYMLDNYSYKQPLKQSQKFTAFIEKCKVPLIKLSLQVEALSEFQILSSLLSSKNNLSVSSGNPVKASMSHS